MASLTPLVSAALQTVALTVLTFASAALPAQAQSSTEATSQSRQFSSEAGGLVLETQTLMSANQNAEALRKIKQLLAMSNLSPYEKSVIFQMQGALFFERNQYDLSIAAFEKAINTGGLTSHELKMINWNLVQLLIVNNEYGERELCYLKIKQAYDADVTVFNIDDPKCEKYKLSFDQKFRFDFRSRPPH